MFRCPHETGNQPSWSGVLPANPSQETVGEIFTRRNGEVQRNSCRMAPPSDVCWFIKPINIHICIYIYYILSIVISTINHRNQPLIRHLNAIELAGSFFVLTGLYFMGFSGGEWCPPRNKTENFTIRVYDLTLVNYYYTATIPKDPWCWNIYQPVGIILKITVMGSM